MPGLKDTETGGPIPQYGTAGSAHVTEGGLTPLGYQQITSLSAATALTVPAGARLAIIQAEVQSVRWRDDGTNPTSSIGMVLAAGYDLVYTGTLSAIKFIETTASAKLNISYFK